MERNKQNYRWRFGSRLGLILIVMVLLFADFIATDRPLLQICNGVWSFPAFVRHNHSMQEMQHDCSFSLYAPIRYNPYSIDTKNKGNLSPIDKQDVTSIGFRHWLGTDKTGRDVAAGIIHGARNSLWIGLCATFFGLLLGVPYGLMLGYYQDNQLYWNTSQVLLFLICLCGFVFYMLYPPQWEEEWVNPLLFVTTFGFLVFIFRIFSKLPIKKYAVPVDLVGYRLLEWRKSIPALFLLLALISVFAKPSIWYLVIIIGFLAWADVARMIRAETLLIKSNLYVLSGIASGFSHGYLMKNYILPGLKNSIIVISMYMMAGSILLESTLSFLGLGLPVEEVSWGKMLAESRNAKAWWMAVFPGLCLVGLLFWLHARTDKLELSA